MAKRTRPPTPMVIEDMNGNVLREYSPDLLETIKATVAKEATDEELYVFLQVSSMYKS